VLPPGTLDDDFNREQPWHPRHWDSTLTRRAWPARGAVSSRGVTAQYRAELPLVLRDVSFEVNAGWKVGIVRQFGPACLIVAVCKPSQKCAQTSIHSCIDALPVLLRRNFIAGIHLNNGFNLHWYVQGKGVHAQSAAGMHAAGSKH